MNRAIYTGEIVKDVTRLTCARCGQELRMSTHMFIHGGPLPAHDCKPLPLGGHLGKSFHTGVHDELEGDDDA